MHEKSKYRLLHRGTERTVSPRTLSIVEKGTTMQWCLSNPEWHQVPGSRNQEAASSASRCTPDMDLRETGLTTWTWTAPTAASPPGAQARHSPHVYHLMDRGMLCGPSTHQCVDPEDTKRRHKRPQCGTLKTENVQTEVDSWCQSGKGWGDCS